MISEKHLRRILDEAQIRPHKVRYWLNKKYDKKREEAIRHICHVYRVAPERLAEGELTLSVDEISHSGGKSPLISASLENSGGLCSLESSYL